MALAPGTRLGVFELIDLLGRGGMGEVYRATDTKLKRQVAIKILPTSLVGDHDRLARFQREAEVLASLNHPNIAAIYGLEESAGMNALVMELVEGDDLSQRIARGAIPLDDALPIAKQIAEALEAAHEQGIIHRDLKPANIKVRSDGTVKVLDFGLAKAMEPVGAMSPSMSMSPTLTTPAMTQAGMILGTATYMSPEQAKGRSVDKRSDVWAFGVVLFEMLTGTRAFPGEGISETLARVLEREPDWSRLPATTASATASASRGRLPWMAALAVAAVAIIALAVPALRHVRETPPPASPETRTEIVTPATDRPTDFALSPDGRQIVFVASGDGASRLWRRSLATTTAQPLAGTDGATSPFWAPDSRAVGFFANGQLKRIDLGGGAPQTLAPVTTTGYGGTWNADGVILFAPSAVSALMRVAATGGAAVAVTTLAPQQQGHRTPYFLPDGRRFVFYALGVGETAGIYLGALDGGPPTRLTPADGGGAYLPSGWLVWVRAGTLRAQRLDVTQAALTGEPVMLADDVAGVSVAATGLLAYRTGVTSQRQLTWVDRAGTARGTLGDPDSTLQSPRVSPDGRRVAVGRTMQGNQDLWLLDGARASRVTFDTALDSFPRLVARRHAGRFPVDPDRCR